jgi:quinohemoprotein ethanol dehydrogenase
LRLQREEWNDALKAVHRWPPMILFIATVLGGTMLLDRKASAAPGSASPDMASTARYLDSSDGRDWPGYGRTFGQDHYSPLAQIDQSNVTNLGLAWSMDLGQENSATQPIEVDGVLYFATGLSVVQAVAAVSGKLLWRYDPKAAEKAGLNLRLAWGVRGIAWWNGKVYTGTQDGRLIAIDAKSGQLVWSVQTFPHDYPAHINGAPRVFNGKVIVGYASTTGATRGYVTTYDAETGKKLWRFYTVPGNPKDGFENKAMEMAAKTWAGHWWKFGGGADVWNATAYDAETDTVYIGTGSAYPWNRRARSADQGDNLFVASIVALDGNTGAYRWHYQVSPGDTWDHDATMDIELADLIIDGKPRKVLLQAPKNGFFYVIDRITGQFISAQPYAKVTWASCIDAKSGRPVEMPGARYPNGTTADIWPSGIGAHSWMPMAYSPKSRLAYIPVVEYGGPLSDKNIDLLNWRPPTDRAVEGALGGGSENSETANGSRAMIAKDIPGQLVAWNPVTQKAMWKVPHPTYLNGGVLATGGDLVFQGTVDGTIKAYAASTGKVLWSFAAQAPLIGTPISYAVNGHQYVTVLTGLGMGIVAAAGLMGERVEHYGIDPRSQARRALTFAMGGNNTLPPAAVPPAPPNDPAFKPDLASAAAGQAVYSRHCATCHGYAVIASIQGPDLRRSSIPLVAEAFASIVRDGALIPKGMPDFGELSDAQLAGLRQYIRTEAQRLRDRESLRVRFPVTAAAP